MDSTIDFKNNDDLAFFGKVNASISHELKNILAIISEAAGLLQDLTEMAAKGQKIELEMLNTCSQDIIEEIQRGFTTIKQMNTFSHSVDVPLKSVNLIEVLDLMINLAGFLSFAGKVRFDPPPGRGSDGIDLPLPTPKPGISNACLCIQVGWSGWRNSGCATSGTERQRTHRFFRSGNQGRPAIPNGRNGKYCKVVWC